MSPSLQLPEKVENLFQWRHPADGEIDFDSPPESVLVTGAAIAAGVATRRGLMALWKKWSGTEPPINPAAPGVSWSEALIWAAAVGAAVGVSRVLSRRGTTAAVKRISSS